MNCEKGPAKDPNVRLALRLGTDTQKIAETVSPNFKITSNGTVVGPSFTAYFVDEKPPYDPAKAKELLAQAGYADGLDITLQCQNAWSIPQMGTVWKEQMAQIGVNVDLQTVPPENYYGTGKDNWLDCEFGITDWGSRPSARMYFQLSYVTDAPWSSSHWSDPEFDEVVSQIQTETDEAKRNELYQQAQQILFDRQPVVMMSSPSR